MRVAGLSGALRLRFLKREVRGTDIGQEGLIVVLWGFKPCLVYKGLARPEYFFRWFQNHSCVCAGYRDCSISQEFRSLGSRVHE